MPTTPTTHVFRTVDGHAIRADVHRPPHVARPPVAVFLHGGALIWGTRLSVPAPLLSELNRRGIAVVSCDYRLAPETKLSGIVGDIEAALAWLRGPGSEDLALAGDRLAVIGSSAGGYLALLSGTFAQRPAAIVSLYGYGDILGAWYTQPSVHYCKLPPVDEAAAAAVVGDQPLSEGAPDRFAYYLRTRQQATWVQSVAGLDPVRDGDALTRFCPVRNISPDYPPTLLFHGDNDTDVPWEQSAQMAEQIRAAGAACEFVTMPGRGHAFDRDADAVDVKAMFARIGDFLAGSLM